jgi:hypothetical protein
MRHSGFGPIGNHFDGVDEVLALSAQALEPCLRRQLFIRNMSFGGPTLVLEVRNLFLQRSDDVL